MNKIIKILMDRDGMAEDEARNLFNETQELLLDAEDPDEVEDILMDELGLEPDYLFDILY